MKNFSRKIKIENQAIWPHLRSGWGVVNKIILALHNPNSRILFEDYLERVFGPRKTIDRPWVGFFHNTPENHPSTKFLYGFQHDTSLGSILDSESFKQSVPNCLGIFTLSAYLKVFIQKKYPRLPVDSLLLCTGEPENHFDMQKFKESPSVVTIGHWQRLFHNINKLKGVEKKFLKWSSNVNVNWWFGKHGIERSPDLTVVERLDNAGYDDLLTRNAVFLELFDAAANNIIVECILRNTPVIVNRLPGLCEYLGEEYPLFYESFEQAQHLATDNEMISRASDHLKGLDKTRYSPEYFISSLAGSSVYRSLPDCRIAKIFM